MSAEAFRRLETAKERLDEGRAGAALSLLARPVPRALSCDRDFLRAEALRAQGFFNGAEKDYRRVLAAGARAEGDLRAQALLGLAAIWRSLGRTREAKRALAGAAAAAGAGGRRRYAHALGLERALVLRAEGRYREALKALAAFLADYRRRRDHGGEAFILWATGGARRFAGDLAGSRRDFLGSLAAAKRARDRQGMAYALFGLGGVSRILGRLADAQDFYAEAGRLLRGGDDYFGLAYAQCGLANALRQRGDLSRARAHYLRSHALYTRLGDWVDLAYVDWGLGKVALAFGELPEAARRLRLALAGFSRGAETRGVVLSELALAGLEHARGRTREGEALFRSAWSRARKAGIHAHLEIFT